MRFAARLGVLMVVGLLSVGGGCAKRGKGLSKTDKETMKAHVLDDLPADVPHKVDVNYEDKVHLLGWKADPETATPGSVVHFTLYWKKTGDLDPGWKLFTHVTTDNTREARGNLDCVGAIRQEKAANCSEQIFGPSDWEKGKVILDTFDFSVPSDVQWSTYRFLTGVWKGDARLQIKNKEASDDENRANIIVLSTGVKAPEPTPQKTELPNLQAPKFGKNDVTLDGKLDEPAWQKAANTGPFVDPGDGRAMPDHPVSAVARVGWDDTNLYVAFNVDDKDPVAPFKPTDKDPHIWEKSSGVELMIQPGDPGDNKDYYEIQVDTSGAVFDTHWDDYNVPITPGPTEATKVFGHMDWVSNLRTAASTDKSKGYTIEIAVPWASFAKGRTDIPPQAGDTWRINFYAFRDNQAQSLAWSPILRQGNFHKSARFGQVTFVLVQGGDVKPPAGAPSPSSRGVAGAAGPSVRLAPGSPPPSVIRRNAPP